MPSFDQTIIQSVVANAEATINKFVRNSVGMGIRQLIANYDKKLNKSVGYENNPGEYLSNNFKFDLASLKNPIDKEAMAYLLEQARSPINKLDFVTLYLPSIDASNSNLEQCYPLALVLPLVWLALKDHERYQHNYYPTDKALNELTVADKNKAFNDARKDYADRLASFYSCVRKLHSHPLCHLGIRHELMFILNKTYQGLDFIEDARASVRDLLRCKLTAYFHQYYANSKTESLASLYEWMRGSNAKNFRGKVDPNGEIKQFLQAFIISHGSRADQELDDMLDQALETLTFENDSQYPILATVNKIFNFLIDEDSNSPRDKALTVFQAWLIETFDLNNQEHEEIVIRFYTICIANENLKKYALLLRVSGKSFPMLEQKSTIYFNDILVGNVTSDNGITGAAHAFEQELRECKAATKNDEVENFFAKWFSKDRKTKQFLYNMLLDTYSVDKIIFKTDEDVANFKNNLPVDSADTKQVTPYEINRVILHGLLTNHHEWTTGFKEIFAAVLTLVQNLNQTAHSISDTSLKASSYPKELILQLRYLLDEANGGSLFPHPGRVIVFPHQINCIEDWFALNRFLEPEKLLLIYVSKRVVIEKILIEKFQEHLQKPIWLSGIIDSIPAEYRLDFSKSKLLSESFKHIKTIKSILPSLAHQDQLTLLKDPLNLALIKARIVDSSDIADILDFLKPQSELPFLTDILTIDFVKKYIPTSYSMSCIIDKLAIENQLVFLTDVLTLNFVKTFIKNGENLETILYFLREQNQILFLVDTLTLNYVKTLLKKNDDLTMVMNRLLPQDSRLAFLTDTLTVNYVKTFVKKSNDIVNIVGQLSPHHRLPFIIENLSIDFVKTFIRNSEDLSGIMFGVHEQYQLALIDRLTLNYVKTLIKNAEDIANLVKRFKFEAELDFLTKTLTMDFVKNYIKSSKDIAVILADIKLENQLAFITNMLTPEFVKTYVKTSDDLLLILSSLKPENQLLFLNDPLLIGSFIGTIKHDFNSNYVLKLVLASENVTLLPLLTNVVRVRNKLWVNTQSEDDMNDIGEVLESLIPNSLLTTFAKTYNALREGQNSYFKTNWLKTNNLNEKGKGEQLFLIIEHALKNPNSRTAKALELTIKYLDKPNSNKFLTDIYNYSFAHSGLGIFRNSRIANTTIYTDAALQQQISQNGNNEIDFNNAPKGSRRHKILTAMKR